MRNISFSMTTAQVRAKQKTVTRRLGWTFLQPGVLLQPVVKAQGLKKGERAERIGGPIRVVSVRRERLDAMLRDYDYGRSEVIKEGFQFEAGANSAYDFVRFFADSHHCRQQDEVTRIEFEYVEE